MCDLLQNVKTAVFVGKDRQSDFLSYLTVSPVIQEALKKQKNYILQRIPEKYTPYKKNAATQKNIVYPADVCANKNGEVFILDAGAACIHVIDRSIVAAVYFIGKYNSPNLDDYSKAARNNCSRAKKCVRTQFRAMKVKRIVSSALSSHDDNLYVLRQKKRTGQVVQLMSFNLKKKKSQVPLEYNVLIKIHPSFSISKLFAVPFDCCFGGMVDDDEFKLKIVYYKSVSKRKVSEFDIDVKTRSKPFLHTDGSLITVTDTGLAVHRLLFNGRVISKTLIDSHELDGVVSSLCMNGKVISTLVFTRNSYALFQLGRLNFAVRYANAVLQLYDAIGYVPPEGGRGERLARRNISFSESLSKGKESIKLLQDMQNQAENSNPNRSSFRGADGMPWTDTINSFVATVESWEVNKMRADHIKQGSSDLIQPAALGSEKNVEHSFGYTTRKGQGHNMSMQEYIIAKRKFATDFQLRMCQMPFCQHTKENIRDKGYQQIEGDRCKITSRELKEIFTLTEKETVRKNVQEVPECDRILLNKAFAVAKSVPRQTNRAKWRERSGFTPNLLSERSAPGMIRAQDLVCCHSITGSLMFLIVQEDVLLSDSDVKVLVRFPDGTISFYIGSDKLVVTKEQIMALPSQLYEVTDDGEVKLDDAVSSDFDFLSDNQSTDLTEEEWALLTDTSYVNSEVSINSGKKRKKQSNNVGSNGGKKMKT